MVSCVGIISHYIQMHGGKETSVNCINICLSHINLFWGKQAEHKHLEWKYLLVQKLISRPHYCDCLCPFPVSRAAFDVAAWALKSNHRCSGKRYWSERAEPHPKCSGSGQECCSFISSLPCQELDVTKSENCHPGLIRSHLPRSPPRGSRRRWKYAIDEREPPSHGWVMGPPRTPFPRKKPLDFQPGPSCDLSSICPNYS